jgi:DNA invertase Pin-like site-specific DNA recombinase
MLLGYARVSDSSQNHDLQMDALHAGLAAAASRGRRGGRPVALDEFKIRAARAMLASGNMSAIEVAQQLGCAPSTLYRHLPGGRSAVEASSIR